MHLQLTVAVPPSAGATHHPRPTEVEVEAPSTATSRDLAVALGEHLASDVADPVLSVSGERVDADAAVGVAPLVDGASVTVGSGSVPANQRQPPRRSPLCLAVSHGPDAGRVVDLAPVRHTIGRAGDATVGIDDPRVSRLHAELLVTVDGISLRDLGSTNGTFLDGVRVGDETVAVTTGMTIMVGDTQLDLRPARTIPAASTPAPDGTRSVNRRPRLVVPTAPISIALPPPPDEPRRVRVPWVALVLPLPVAAVMVVFFGPMMLAFAVMSPLLMAGSALGDRLGSRRSYAAELADHQRHHRAAMGRVAAASAEEARARRRDLPDPAEVLTIATTPSSRLWERRRTDPDALTVSLGRCTVPAALRVIRPPQDDGPEHLPLRQVPCAVPLAAVGVLGVCGARATVHGVVRWVLGQLTTLHSPLDLRLTVVSRLGADHDWTWLSRLPHVRDADGRPRWHWASSHDRDPAAARTAVADLVEVVRRRRATATGPDGPWTGPRTVVVLDGCASLRSLPGLAEVLEHGPSVGVVCIALDTDRAQLPSEAGAVLDLTSPAEPVLTCPGTEHGDLLVDSVGPWWADRLSRGLAPLRDATPRSDAAAMPASVGLVELMGQVDGATVRTRWAETPHSTRVSLGRTAGGDFELDLAKDGPHLLVAGTTGSGKSELLRTLVAALALRNRPEHLSFVLIDYKGGAAFQECARLPHTAGVVTDLDEHLAGRALTSLKAELKRREAVLASVGASDFVAYQSSSHSGAPPLPRLVIVVDEFRALAEELPAFVDGMVRVAALGRSLGVHVVLATQRPAGVVTADIKANVNLRVALRVRDRVDSDDVIDAPDAAALDQTTPGRAYARTGGGALVLFQACFASGRSGADEPAGIRVRKTTWHRAPGRWPEPTVADAAAASDLSTVVDAVVDAARHLGAIPAPPAWLPSLPDQLDFASLPEPVCDLRVAVGLADYPATQSQEPLEVDLAAPGHWAFVGAAGSGRTTALLTAARALATARAASRLHIYAVSGGSLAGLTGLPHCGAHVQWDDVPRLERLVARLSREVADRRRRLAESGAASMVHWWRTPGTEGAPPPLVVLVDDWDQLAHRTDELTHGTLTERLLGVLREGAAVGLTALVTGERALVAGRAASAVAHRVLLRLADPTDLVLAGVRSATPPTHQPPGRGVLLDGTEVQLARHAGPTNVRGESGTGPRPWRVDALPTHVGAAGLVQRGDVPDETVVGVGGDVLGPEGLSPARDGRRWLVCGSNGSGVSTALTVIALDLLRRGRTLAVVAPRPGPLAAIRDATQVTWCGDPGRAEELVTARRAVPHLAVVVDDADGLGDSPVGLALKELAGLVDRDGGLVVCGANAAALSLQYRGLAVEVARHRTGVLLGPSSVNDADLFGLRLPVERGAAPGRGYVVRQGQAVPIQVAQPAEPG